MSKKLESVYLKDEDGSVKEVPLNKLFTEIKKTTGCHKDAPEKLLKLALKDKDFEPDPDMEKEEKKALVTADKMLRRSLAFHYKHEDQLAKEAEEEEKRQRTEGEAIVLSAEKGRALSTKITSNLVVDGIQRVLPKGFTMHENGLTVDDKAEPQEKDFSQVIGGLLATDGGLSKVRGSVNWALGDACIALESMFPERAQEIIQQVSNIHGVEKHTVERAKATCAYFTLEERVDGLSFTHHQTVLDGSKSSAGEKAALTKAQGLKMLREAFVEEGMPIKNGSGENVEARKEPISCAALRAQIKEKTGKTKPEPQEKEHLFLYINDDGVGKTTEGFNKKLAKAGEFWIYDLTDMTHVNNDGVLRGQITPYGEDGPLIEEELIKPEEKPVTKKVKAPKPAKEVESDITIPD